MYFDVPDSRHVIDDFRPALLIPDEDWLWKRSLDGCLQRELLVLLGASGALLTGQCFLNSHKSHKWPPDCLPLLVGQKYQICLAVKFTIAGGNLQQKVITAEGSSNCCLLFKKRVRLFVKLFFSLTGQIFWQRTGMLWQVQSPPSRFLSHHDWQRK